MSADAFAAFEEVGLDNSAEVRKVGRRFRQTVLALGGSVSAKKAFKSFRGRPPSIDPLLRHYGFVDAASSSSTK